MSATKQFYMENLEEFKKESITRIKFYFFMAAAISFVLSIYLFFFGDKTNGIFVAIWVPSILSAANLILEGNYNE